jgi:hypothetical protein
MYEPCLCFPKTASVGQNKFETLLSQVAVVHREGADEVNSRNVVNITRLMSFLLQPKRAIWLWKSSSVFAS